MPKYAYRGNPNVIAELEPRLSEAGFTREGELDVADIVITYCTLTSELDDLYFGDNGIIQTLQPGNMVIDLSPTTPNFAKEAGAIAAVNDLVFVEAPLVVKNMTLPEAFSHNNVTCFVAGEEGVADKASEILNVIFCEVLPVGGAGAAQIARITNTLQRVSEIVSAIESSALFKASRKSVSSVELHGMKPEATCPAAFYILQAIEEQQFKSSFTCEMLYAELVSAIMAADDYELIMPQAEAASHLLELMAVIGGSDLSPAALSLAYASEEECAKHGLDWSRARVFYSDEQDDEANAGFDDGYDAFDDGYYGDDPEVGYGYSAN